MEFIISVAVGATVGALVAVCCRSLKLQLSTCVTVGILGGLLGLAADFWLATGGISPVAFSAPLAAGVGAILALTLWIVAQLLFLNSPTEGMGDQ